MRTSKKIDIHYYYFKLNEVFFGKILGSEKEFIATNLLKLTDDMKKYLVKETLSVPEFHQPRFKIFTITYNPEYYSNDEIILSDEKVTVKLPSILYTGDEGQKYCYMLQTGESIQYHRPDQFKRIADFRIRNFLSHTSKKDLFQINTHPDYVLGKISFTMKGKKTSKRIVASQINDYEINEFSKFADKYPQKIALKNKFVPEKALERNAEIQQVESRFNQQANILLVGESGVGKSAIINNAIVDFDNRHKSTEGRLTFWRTNPKRIIAGAMYLGDWQELCDNFANMLAKNNGYVWLNDFISLFTVVGEGVEDSMAAYIIPYIKKGYIKIIGELSYRQLDAIKRIFPGFIDYFQIVYVEEMQKPSVIKIINYIDEQLKKEYEVEIELKAKEYIFQLLQKFLKYDRFPGKLIQFMNLLINRAIQNADIFIDRDIVTKAFSEYTGMSELFLNDNKMMRRSDLQNYFNKRIKGQANAIEHVTSVIKVFKTGLNDPNKPISSMIFAGPTGVGKTATARALADYFFSNGNHQNTLVRFDMSEFQHAFQIYRLIGNNKDNPGKLVQHVRENPFSVILFDEIEKANPIIFDTLLTILDEGIMYDSFGRVTDFRNTIIILTTNLGAKNNKSVGFVVDDAKEYTSAVKKHFRPEFFNRIDSVITYNSLDKLVIKEIARKELDEINAREGMVKRKLKIQFTEELVEYIAKVGFDEKYGARPLQRKIESLLIAGLSEFLIKHKDLKNKKINCSLNVENEIEFAVLEK